MTQPGINVLSHFWAPLCAVGSHGQQGPNAQICVSVFGASIVPERPRLLVVLSNTNYTTGLVAAAGTVTVSVLGERQAAMLEPLGLRSGRDSPKLEGLEYAVSAAGDPYFQSGAGWAACEVLESFDLGDSTAFLAAVREKADGAERPLSWQTAKGLVGAEFLERWANKSVVEQETARQAMT